MNSIGVRRSVAACANLLALTVGPSIYAADCAPSTLSPQATRSRLGELGKSAQVEMAQRRFTDAIRNLKEATCLDPNDPRIFYSLGSAEAASGDFLAARRSLVTADRLQPANPLPLVMLTRVNTSMNDMDSLKATLSEAAVRFPATSDLHGTLAQFLLQNKLFDLALAEALRSQKAGGATAQSMMDLAVLENTVGAYDDAIRNAVSIQNQTDLPDAVRASAAGIAGLSYESAGQPEQAISHLRNAIQLDPSRENSYLALAFLFEKQQKYGEAVEVLEQGRAKLPQSTSLLLPLGSDMILAEKYAAGISVLQDLLRKTPHEYDAYPKLADAFRKTGASDKEVQILRDLENQKADYPRIQLLLARAMLNLDPIDYVQTLDQLALAEQRSPLDAEIFYLRGKIYVATNHIDEGIVALRRAIELEPMDPGPYYQLGRLYEKLGRTQMAKDTFARMQYLMSNAIQQEQRDMYRRRFLTTIGTLYSSTSFARGFAATALGRFKLGAISDGFSQDFEEALKIMKSFGLGWVEIRAVFGIYNTEASPAQIRRLKDLLETYQFRVSVIDSALYKCALPGTMPAKRGKDIYAYSDQIELLKRACDRAHTLGTDRIRGFTFWRVTEPEKLSQRIAEELTKAAEVANRAGMRLVIENEGSCNAATGRELASILTMAPAPNLGANWDVGNGYSHGEISFPDGYRALDKKRIWHMHLKGIACDATRQNCSESLVGQSQIDLTGQFTQLIRDGYQETMSLECEFKAPGLTHVETSRRSLEGLLKVMNAAAAARDER